MAYPEQRVNGFATHQALYAGNAPVGHAHHNNHSPQPGYQQPPPGQPYGQPQYPPQPYGGPSPAGYNPYQPPPPSHSPYHQAPYGAPQQPPYQQPFGGAPPPAGPPAPPSLGYDPRVIPHTDMSSQAAELRDTMKGFGTNELKLIGTLAKVPDAPHMLKLRHTYDDRFRRSLLSDLESETSGHFRQTLLAACRGPLLQDAFQVDRAIRGAGTKESLLNDVVLGRQNADLIAIKNCFRQWFHKDMAAEVRGDLSLKTAKLFDMVLEARRTEESAPVLPHEVEANVDRIQQATEGTKFGTNQEAILSIMAYSSDGMIRAINLRYTQKFRASLDDVFRSNFSGHMKDALRLMAARAVDPIKSDADQLEESMKGLGTKDEQLLTRVVRVHWDKNRLAQVKIAYKKFHNRDLVTRIHGETSGDYRRLLVALVS